MGWGPGGQGQFMKGAGTASSPLPGRPWEEEAGTKPSPPLALQLHELAVAGGPDRRGRVAGPEAADASPPDGLLPKEILPVDIVQASIFPPVSPADDACPAEASAKADLPAEASAKADLPAEASAKADLPAEASAKADLPAEASAKADGP